MPNKRNIWIIVKKLVLAASVYFLWQERNLRLFQRKKRTWEELRLAMEEMIKMKIASLKVMMSENVKEVYEIWGIDKCITRTD